MIESSLREFGAGRSVLVDRDGNLIAGNKTAANALKAGIEDAIIVETTGDKLVVVKRTDLGIDDAAARALAIADNRTGQVSLEWDADVLRELSIDVPLDNFFTPNELSGLLDVQSASGLLSTESDTSSTPLKYLKVGKYEIPLDEHEYNRFVAHIQNYVEASGSLFGFGVKVLAGLDNV